MDESDKYAAEWPSDDDSNDGHATSTVSCAWPDCTAPGDFKAPRSPKQLRDYYLFCLDHVREYNKSWNFYRDLSEQEMEAAIRSDLTWNRPTWPLGGRGNNDLWNDAENARPLGSGFGSIHDPFGFFHDENRSEPNSQDLPKPARDALRTLGLSAPITIDEVKARYKTLVKRHHPDANGGDPAAEERIKEINHAYETLTKTLVS